MDRLDTCSDDEHDDNDDERGVTHAEELREVIAYFHARVDRSRARWCSRRPRTTPTN